MMADIKTEATRRMAWEVKTTRRRSVKGVDMPFDNQLLEQLKVIASSGSENEKVLAKSILILQQTQTVSSTATSDSIAGLKKKVDDSTGYGP